jgi:hypothetical protein
MRYLKNINIINGWVKQVTQATFNHILEVTDKMLGSASNGQWDELFLLEKQRDALIKKYFINIALKDEGLAGAIRQVLSKDLEIQSKVKQERERLGQSLQKMAHGKNAVQSYANVG